MGYPFVEPLSPGLVEKAKELRKQGDKQHKGLMGWKKISRLLGVSERAVWLHFDPKALRRKRELNRQYSRSGAGADTASGIVPARVLAERERLLSLERDPIRELMGDPLPGRSALDQKRREGAMHT